MSVIVKESQMISFDGRCRYNASHHFGNPLDLSKILEAEKARLKKGLATSVTITGRPFRQFYGEYAKMRSMWTIVVPCEPCDGKGEITIWKRQIRHWRGAQLYAFTGLAFKTIERCKACEGFGFRQWIAK